MDGNILSIKLQKTILISIGGFIGIALLAVLVYKLVMTNTTVNEGWINYKQQPFGNIYTGAGDLGVRPLVFYNEPRYRRPLNWPACHLVDYPVPHCKHDP
jgi:hypothetical protein